MTRITVSQLVDSNLDLGELRNFVLTLDGVNVAYESLYRAVYFMTVKQQFDPLLAYFTTGIETLMSLPSELKKDATASLKDVFGYPLRTKVLEMPVIEEDDGIIA